MFKEVGGAIYIVGVILFWCGFGQLVQDVAALAYKSSIQPEIIYRRR